MAAVAMLGNLEGLEIIACSLSGEVLAKVAAGDVDGAVLPIENSLHGSVAEHYDLLLELPWCGSSGRVLMPGFAII